MSTKIREENADSCRAYETSEGNLALAFPPGTLRCFPLEKFQHLTPLTYLSIPGSTLTEITKDIFSMFPNLIWLDLRDNQISSFPDFTNHKSLESILLGGNKISRLPIELGSFDKLACLQVSGNPLVFPELDILEKEKWDIVTFLQKCWQQQTEKPDQSRDKERKAILKLRSNVKKSDCMRPVQILRNVSNVVVDKMKSGNAIDQVLAAHIVKKLRVIEKELQKMKDRDVLRNWREKYMGEGVATREMDINLPFDTDPEYLKMMDRRDLNKYRLNPQHQNKLARSQKCVINIEQEFRKLEELLAEIKRRKVLPDPSSEMSQRMIDMKKMDEIQKRIRNLKLLN